jgi:hypothetical protein
MRVIVEQLVEWKLAGETEVLGENLPPAPLCPPQNPTWQTRSRTPDRSGGKPATNRLLLIVARLAYSTTLKTEVVTILRNVGKFLPHYTA